MRIAALLAALLVVLAGRPLSAQGFEEQTMMQARDVLQELGTLRIQHIPQSLLSSAEGVVIIPGVVRGAFVVGLQHGRGVVLAKDEAGNWQPPQFLTITGGSLGWQAGLQSTDLVLVFRTRKSVANLLSGKITVGVDAAAAAGPVGRRASAATDLDMKAEILSYSRSRGLFAGVSVDGSSLQVDPAANARYYGPSGERFPASAELLMVQLGTLSASRISVPTPASPTASSAAAPPADPWGGIAGAAARLHGLLDPAWRQHLSTAELSATGNGTPLEREELGAVAERFRGVAARPEYQPLTRRPEFERLWQLIQQQVAAGPETAAAQLQLPPPPTNDSPSRGRY